MNKKISLILVVTGIASITAISSGIILRLRIGRPAINSNPLFSESDGNSFTVTPETINSNQSSGTVDSNGLFNNVTDDIAMVSTANNIAKKWKTDAVPNAVIMISGNKLKNAHVVYFSSKIQPDKYYHVGLDYNNNSIPGSNDEGQNHMQDIFGNVGYLSVNNIRVSSAESFQKAKDYAQNKIKYPLGDYDTIFLLMYNKDINANVWLYSLRNKTISNDIFKIMIDASSGNIINASTT